MKFFEAINVNNWDNFSSWEGVNYPSKSSKNVVKLVLLPCQAVLLYTTFHNNKCRFLEKAWELANMYLHSHCMTSRLNCWTAPMLICFNSLSSSICIKDVDRCWQADMQAVWATFPYVKQIKSKQKASLEIHHKIAQDCTQGTLVGTILIVGLSASILQDCALVS